MLIVFRDLAYLAGILGILIAAGWIIWRLFFRGTFTWRRADRRDRHQGSFEDRQAQRMADQERRTWDRVERDQADYYNERDGK